MSITLPATVTGAPATGFTSPVYTASADSSPNSNSKQIALIGLTSGTAAGIRYHAASDPFTLTYERPSSFKGPSVVATNGVLPVVGRNDHFMRTRKGVIVVVGQNPQVFLLETKVRVPAGSEANDAVNIRAALSAHIGLLQQLAASWGDTLVAGIL